jgi:hypothetical protein
MPTGTPGPVEGIGRRHATSLLAVEPAYKRPDPGGLADGRGGTGRTSTATLSVAPVDRS